MATTKKKESKNPYSVRQEEDTTTNNVNNREQKEGYNLLGSPTFEKLENGRFKCIETGHETLGKDRDSYINSKRCRLGLIDTALSQKKPPLNIFKQDHNCKLKLVCKLTGDIVNKSEEHIWKHINGKRFLNKLEQKELEALGPNQMAVDKVETELNEGVEMIDNGAKRGKKKEEKRKKDKSNVIDKDAMREKEPSENGSDSEEAEFWAPPVGSRWDNDNGRDRWGSDTESGQESDDEDKIGIGGDKGVDSGELSTRTKRMSIEIGPSNFASRKKKSKMNGSGDQNNA